MASEKVFKILGILPHSIGGRLTISSLFDGFKQNGHSVFIFDELNNSDFKNFIKDSEFDYIAGYDFSALKLKVDNNLSMPSLNYFSDVIESNASGVQNEWQKYKEYLNKEHNYTFYWDKDLTENSDIKNIFYMPHFVNTEIYKDLGIEKEYDVMFAGRLDTDLRLDFYVELVKSFPNLKFAWYAIEKHYQDALSRVEDKNIIKETYKGFIDNEDDMAIALNKSKIVFNMNSQGISSLNYRTFQTIACKTLMISDYRTEVGLFKGDMPFYVDFEDLKNKINYFLDNEKAYDVAINNSYQHLLQRHNAKDCAAVILKVSHK